MADTERYIETILERMRHEKENVMAQWENPVGTKTRHFIIDNVLPEAMCREIYGAFPRDGDGFFNRQSFREKKKTSANLDAYDSVLRNITYAIQDKRVVDAVADIVGFQHIEPDPKLYAGGLSMMFEGDFLNPHIDNSHDADRKRYRRLNLLYYVSPDWVVENGGNLELWDKMKTTPKTITAHFNRLVAMETNKKSWHSVSPVTAATPRCCVSNYYFSTQSPDATQYFHVTSFTGRPGETWKRLFGRADNLVRNLVSKTLRRGRGKRYMYKAQR